MCGITGILNFDTRPVELSQIKAMNDVISHRGPDGEGFWTSNKLNVGFGHRRLSIIDLSENGKQPMHYLEQRYTITFNGEIYNYIELKSSLIQNGYTFKSGTDTEVLLALYDLKKENCLQDLDGMFSFAIWDEKEQTLFCARDRFGEKPFYYFKDQTRFVFASEIKQFWAIDINKKIDETKLSFFVEHGTIEDSTNITDTFYKNIKELDAAHCLIINKSNNVHIKRYWDIELKATPFNGAIEQAAETFLELFTDSIRLRLRSDVPVGSSLSGGLDSSSIVMLVDLLKGKEVKQNTFSARFRDYAKDEGAHIEAVVKACKNVEVHYTWPDKDYFESVFDKVTYHQDEPFGSASIVAQYAVMELAKKNKVTVLLDGQGADEQLAGYLPYYHTYLNQLYYSKPSAFKIEKAAYQKFHGLVYPYRSIEASETFRMKLGKHKRKLLKQEMPYQNQLAKNLKVSTTQIGLKELLRHADRNSMAHSREVRLPFLSHKLVEFVFSLPDSYKINNGWTKFVLRKSMNTILPTSITWRVDKVAYEPPQNKWMASDKYEHEIKKAANLFNVKLSESLRDDASQEWRLLMASKYI